MIFLWTSVTTVDSGSVGVLTLFGRVTGEVLPEGIHFINPFKATHQMTVRTQEIKETADVPSQEGSDLITPRSSSNQACAPRSAR